MDARKSVSSASASTGRACSASPRDQWIRGLGTKGRQGERGAKNRERVGREERARGVRVAIERPKNES